MTTKLTASDLKKRYEESVKLPCEAIRDVHTLRHKILTPFLPLDISLQKYIKIKDSKLKGKKEWENAVDEDAQTASKEIQNTKQTVAKLYGTINDTVWKKAGEEMKLNADDTQEELLNRLNLLSRQLVNPKDNPEEVLKNIRGLNSKLSQIVDAVDTYSE